MAIHVDGLTLYTGEESTDTVEANVDATSVQGMAGGERILVALEATESMSVTGVATGNRLSELGAYNNDPFTALAEWLQQFETLAISEQGSGWSLTDDERNRTLTVSVPSLSWTFRWGTIEARWSIDLLRGDNVASSGTRSPSTQSPDSSSTLGGDDLGTVTEKRTQVRVDLEAVPIALAETSDTVLIPQSGQVKDVLLTGLKTGTTSQLRSFDNTMRGNVGGTKDEIELTYQSGMPGTSHTVVIGDYDSTYTAGSPSILSYAMTILEGVSL